MIWSMMVLDQSDQIVLLALIPLIYTYSTFSEVVLPCWPTVSVLAENEMR